MSTETEQVTHTPGPWGVPDEGGFGGRVKVSAGSPGGWRGLIAECDAGNYARSQSEGLANARLIAAAPQLLEACQAALLIDESDSASVDPQEIFDGIRSAIAAATTTEG